MQRAGSGEIEEVSKELQEKAAKFAAKVQVVLPPQQQAYCTTRAAGRQLRTSCAEGNLLLSMCPFTSQQPASRPLSRRARAGVCGGGAMRVEVSAKAYTTLLLHALKYPHAAVNGLLVGGAQVTSVTGALRQARAVGGRRSKQCVCMYVFTNGGGSALSGLSWSEARHAGGWVGRAAKRRWPRRDGRVARVCGVLGSPCRAALGACHARSASLPSLGGRCCRTHTRGFLGGAGWHSRRHDLPTSRLTGRHLVAARPPPRPSSRARRPSRQSRRPCRCCTPGWSLRPCWRRRSRRRRRTTPPKG